jgi:hypothetical protein
MMPSAMAASTQKYSWPYHGLRAAVAVDMPYSFTRQWELQ